MMTHTPNPIPTILTIAAVLGIGFLVFGFSTNWEYLSHGGSAPPDGDVGYIVWLLTSSSR